MDTQTRVQLKSRLQHTRTCMTAPQPVSSPNSIQQLPSSHWALIQGKKKYGARLISWTFLFLYLFKCCANFKLRILKLRTSGECLYPTSNGCTETCPSSCINHSGGENCAVEIPRVWNKTSVLQSGCGTGDMLKALWRGQQWVVRNTRVTQRPHN